MRAVRWPRRSSSIGRAAEKETQGPAGPGVRDVSAAFGVRVPAAVSTFLALIATLLLAGCAAVATGPAVEPVSPTPASAPVVAASPESEASPVADPASVAIPRLGVRADVVTVSLCAKAAPPRCSGADELEVPDVAQVGWYRGSPRPGATGPALLAGHVNWHGQAGPFARIGTLRVGDAITVTDHDGELHRFVVSAVEQFPKADYDAHMPALLANTPGPELRLVTCSGDLVGHNYLDNTVVSARLVA